MHEIGIWTVENGDIVSKSKNRQMRKIHKPLMILDMMEGVLYKFGEKEWVSSCYEYLISNHGENMFMLMEFPSNWTKDDIVTVANFSCSAHNTDKIIYLFSAIDTKYLNDIKEKGF
jgi:hypothetical protein